jgi:hypothetical protein
MRREQNWIFRLENVTSFAGLMPAKKAGGIAKASVFIHFSLQFSLGAKTKTLG